MNKTKTEKLMIDDCVDVYAEVETGAAAYVQLVIADYFHEKLAEISRQL